MKQFFGIEKNSSIKIFGIITLVTILNVAFIIMGY